MAQGFLGFLLQLWVLSVTARRQNKVGDHATALQTDDEGAPLLEFHVYRAGDNKYPSEWSDRGRSRNFANAAGVLRYIHDEVVGKMVNGNANPPTCERKYDISMIYRYKVTMRSTPEAMKHYRYFLPYVAMDKGKCTTPNCMATYSKFGYVPGCQNQDVKFTRYPDAVWYSFPGRCPDREQGMSCDAKEVLEFPGGACRPGLTPDGNVAAVNGTWNCTYIYRPDGQIRLDELVGIRPNFKEFCMKGGVEFNGAAFDDSGLTIDFWRGYKDVDKNRARIRAMLDLFEKRNPGKPLLDDPGCERAWERPWYWPGSNQTRPPTTTPAPTTTSTTTPTTPTTTPATTAATTAASTQSTTTTTSSEGWRARGATLAWAVGLFLAVTRP